MEIRQAKQSDIPQLVAWMEQLVAHVQHTSNDPYVNHLESDYNREFTNSFKNTISASDCMAYIADHDGMAAGFIMGGLSRPYLKTSAIKRIGQIDLCWVEPAHRQHGIATALCQEMEQWFRGQDIHYVDLQYLIGNREAEQSWPRLGYLPYRISARKAL